MEAVIIGTRAPIQWAGWKCRIVDLHGSQSIVCTSNKAELHITPFQYSKKKGYERFGTVRIKGAVNCAVSKKKDLALCDYWQTKTPKRDRRKVYVYKPIKRRRKKK